VGAWTSTNPRRLNWCSGAQGGASAAFNLLLRTEVSSLGWPTCVGRHFNTERVRTSQSHHVRLLQHLLRRRRRYARPQGRRVRKAKDHRAHRVRAAAADAALLRRRRPRQDRDQRRRLQGPPGLRLEPRPHDHQVSILLVWTGFTTGKFGLAFARLARVSGREFPVEIVL